MVALKISAGEIYQMTISATSVILGILKIMMRRMNKTIRQWVSRYHHYIDLIYQFQEKLLSFDHKLDEHFINYDYKNLINGDSDIIKPETRKRRRHHHWPSRTMLMRKAGLDNEKVS